MRLRRIGSVVLGLAALSTAAAGQGSASEALKPRAMAAYDLQHPVLLKGFVEAVDWSGPTTWIAVRIVPDTGEVWREQSPGEVWKAEAAAPSALRASGLDRTLVPGSRITIAGYAARGSERRAGVRRLTAYKPDKLGQEGHVGPVTDELLARYAAKPWSRGFWAQREVPLGPHNGVELVASHLCTHLCPAYTVRVIHYAAKPGPECDRIDGVVQLIQTNFGSLGKAAYCVPKVLVERGLQADRRVGDPGDVAGNPGY
jgi:hypothetical protein